MKLIFVFLAFALIYLGITDGFRFDVSYTEEDVDESDLVPHGAIMTCFCDGLEQQALFPGSDVKEILNCRRRRPFCHPNCSDRVCDLLITCQNCSAVTQKCLPVANSTSDSCFKQRLVMQLNPLIEKDNDATKVKDRVARQVTTCIYPKTLTTADLFCKKYPSKIKCSQKCIFGYTLKEGITKEMQCIHKENVWKPSGFEECKPFVDCTMLLISPGKLACITPTTKSAPVCNVSCERYEDKPATPERSYVCRVSGMWNVKLPYCAVSGSELELVPAPRIKLHSVKD